MNSGTPIYHKTKLCVAVLAVIFAAAVSSQGQLVNRDFQTGDFTGRTFFTTSQGGLGQPAVVLFDTSDTGTPSYSARFSEL